MKKRILLAEDEEHIRDALRMNLEMEGYAVVCVDNGNAALGQFRKRPFDLIILDVMMPEMDGFTVCQAIRLDNDRVPIMFLTAKNAGEDRVRGLKTGGDDYLAKPFNLEEFLLRVQKLIGRAASQSKGEQAGRMEFGSNWIDFGTYEIACADGSIRQLSAREAKLLKLLTEKKNTVVSRMEILDKVWGYDVYPSTRTIDNYILAFRKYFEKNPKVPEYFHSVRGVGYKFVPGDDE